MAAAGCFSLNLNAGIRLTERSSLNLAVRNVLDTNYRVHGSGIDSPGINIYLGYNLQF